MKYNELRNYRILNFFPIIFEEYYIYTRPAAELWMGTDCVRKSWNTRAHRTQREYSNKQPEQKRTGIIKIKKMKKIKNNFEWLFKNTKNTKISMKYFTNVIERQYFFMPQTQCWYGFELSNKKNIFKNGKKCANCALYIYRGGRFWSKIKNKVKRKK